MRSAIITSISTVLVLFFMCTMGVSAQTITISEPNAGSKWERGKPYDIKWVTRGGSIPQVSIMYENRSTGKLTRIVHPATNTGKYSWAIPASMALGKYRILMRPVGGAAKFYSADFQIIPPKADPPKIQLLSPTGGTYTRGDKMTIRWKSTNFKGKVHVALFKSRSFIGLIRWNVPETGSYNWTVGTNLAVDKSTQYKDGADYVIEVFNSRSMKPFARSKTPFTIKSKPVPPPRPVTIRVTTPNAPVRLIRGEYYTIRWSMSRPVPVAIFLAKANNILGHITMYTTLPGSFRWKVGDPLEKIAVPAGRNYTNGSGYTFIVKYVEDPKYSGRSPASFSIQDKSIPPSTNPRVNQPVLNVVPKSPFLSNRPRIVLFKTNKTKIKVGDVVEARIHVQNCFEAYLEETFSGRKHILPLQGLGFNGSINVHIPEFAGKGVYLKLTARTKAEKIEKKIFIQVTY